MDGRRTGVLTFVRTLARAFVRALYTAHAQFYRSSPVQFEHWHSWACVKEAREMCMYVCTHVDGEREREKSHLRVIFSVFDQCLGIHGSGRSRGCVLNVVNPRDNRATVSPVLNLAVENRK